MNNLKSSVIKDRRIKNGHRPSSMNRKKLSANKRK